MFPEAEDYQQVPVLGMCSEGELPLATYLLTPQTLKGRLNGSGQKLVIYPWMGKPSLQPLGSNAVVLP